MDTIFGNIQNQRKHQTGQNKIVYINLGQQEDEDHDSYEKPPRSLTISPRRSNKHAFRKIHSFTF